MTSAEKIKELEAQVDGLVLKVKETEGQRAEMERRLQELETANQDNTRDRAGTHENRFSFPYGPTYYSKPPKFPTSPAKVANWEQRMTLFLESQGLGYTIRHSITPVPIINCIDRAHLVHRFGEQTVVDHEKAWAFLLDATTDAPFEQRLLAATTLEEAWHTITGWHLPTTDCDNELLLHQLENVEMAKDEDPKLFFARVDGIFNTLRSVGIVKEEREIVRIIVRNLSDDYDVEKRAALLRRDITRLEMEEIVRTRYAARQRTKLLQAKSTASSSKAGRQSTIADPHALAVGGFRGGGGRFQRPGCPGRYQ